MYSKTAKILDILCENNFRWAGSLLSIVYLQNNFTHTQYSGSFIKKGFLSEQFVFNDSSFDQSIDQSSGPCN